MEDRKRSSGQGGRVGRVGRVEKARHMWGELDVKGFETEYLHVRLGN